MINQVWKIWSNYRHYVILCDISSCKLSFRSYKFYFICMVMSSIRGEIPSPCPPNLFMKNLLLYLEIFWYPSQNTEPFFQIAGKSEFSDKMLSLYFQLNFWFDWLISWKMWSISLAFFTPSHRKKLLIWYSIFD